MRHTRCLQGLAGGLAGVVVLFSLAMAEPYNELAVIYSGVVTGSAARPEVPENIRDHYQSVGQNYLRTYLRQSMVRFISDQGLPVDLDLLQPAATLDLTSLYDPAQNDLRTKLRFMAGEDFQKYLNCGQNVPVKIELESTYHVLPHLDLQARMDAPFDDLLEVRLGSAFRWSEAWYTRFQYTLRNDAQIYAGLNLGIGCSWQSWILDYSYDVSGDFVHLQHLSLGKIF